MAFFSKLLIIVATLFLIACPFSPDGYWDSSLTVKNESASYVFVQVLSKTRGGVVDHRFGIEPYDYSSMALAGKNSWKTLIENEAGLVVKIFLIGQYDLSADSLERLTPLKTWEIPDWESVEAVNGVYVYK